MSIASERIRRTSRRLAAQERQYSVTQNFLATQSTIRKVETAAWLLALAATELDGDDDHTAANATKLARFTNEFLDALLQRAVAGTCPAKIPCDSKTEPVRLAPPAGGDRSSNGPSAVSTSTQA